MPQWIANSLEQLLDFSNILNASIAAGWVVLAVVVLRFLLKKAPRWIHAALWGLVAVRLLLPFSVESVFSLIPSAETVPQEILVYEGTQLQDPAVFDVVTNPIFPGSVTVELGETVDRVQAGMVKMTPVWLAGIAVLLAYTAVSYWRLRRRVREAVVLRDHIYQSEKVASPFVLGIIRPKIYLPCNMDGVALNHVIAHERAHIRRRDHWWKPLGFLLLTVHWFNPLMWLAYVLLCRDIELACDERVIRELDNEERADYTQALVACSVSRRVIAACPLAFGEVGVKERVKSVLNYKKPAFWLVTAAVAVCAAAAVCFLTDPVEDGHEPLPPDSGYACSVSEVTYESPHYSFSMVAQQNTPVYAIGEAMHLMSMGEYFSEEEWTDLGPLTETELTKENFDRLFADGGNWAAGKTAPGIRRNTARAWTLVYNQDILYYVLRQKTGELYLAYGYYDYTEKDDPGSDDTSIRWLFKLTQENVPLTPEEDTSPEWQSCAVGWSEETFGKMLKLGGPTKNLHLSSIQVLPAVRITDRTQLREFMEEMEDCMRFDAAYPDTRSFEEAARDYDDAFFSTSTLFLLYTSAPTSADRYGIGYVSRFGDTLCFGVEHWQPEAGDAVMEGWLIAVGVPTQRLTGVDEIDARISAVIDPDRVFPAGTLAKTYVFTGSEDPLKPSVSLFDSGEFTFTFSALSSYLGHGHYRREGDLLILNTDDGKFTYVFEAVGDTLVFDADASSRQTWFSGIHDGAVFE